MCQFYGSYTLKELRATQNSKQHNAITDKNMNFGTLAIKKTICYIKTLKAGVH